MTHFLKRNFETTVLMGLIIVLGIFLRLYQLESQIIGDDEWHAIRVASNYSYQHIWTHFHEADNCIPMTLIYKLLLNTVGLNELTLHLFQAATGIAILVSFPIMAARIFGRNVATIFALFLSLSPFLIHYSRFARPYIFVVFLSFLAFISFYRWLESNEKKYLFIYVAATILCPYFSLISFPSLVSPILFSAFYLALNTKRNQLEIQPVRLVKPKEILVISAVIGIGISMWFIPTLGSFAALSSKVGQGRFQLDTMYGFLKVFSGFGDHRIALGLLLAFFVGLICLYNENKFFLGYVTTIIVVQISSVLIANPYDSDVARIFSRYNIVLLPLYLLVISLGIWNVANKICEKTTGKYQGKTIVTLSATVITLFLYLYASPIASTYTVMNSFSNHNDFQFGEDSGLIENKKKLDVKLVSTFYNDLGQERADTIIIEFPYVMWWSGNVGHYYQQVHKKRVKMGYWEPYYSIPAFATAQVKLNNFTNIGSYGSLVQSGAKYLVIHKDMAWENLNIKSVWGKGKEIDKAAIHAIPNEWEDNYGPFSRQIASQTIAYMHGMLGEPCFEDHWIVAFKIPQSTPG